MKLDGWDNTPPTQQGIYWHWNGDHDSAPYAMRVMYSGTSGKCFVCITDDPLTRDVDDEVHEGWWQEIPDPMLPNVPRQHFDDDV